MDLYLTIAIIGIGITLFIKDYFSIDTTSILIMSLFIISGVLTPEEGFSGFNHPATLTLGCMFVVSAAIFKTGLINGFSRYIIWYSRKHYLFALIIFCFFSVFLSAFVNDSAVVALLIPLALIVCKNSGIPPSKLLIPISFSALMGGTCTLIGTSANILVSSYAEKSGLKPFSMFEFTLPALCIIGFGLLYLIVAGPFLLPKRAEEGDDLSKTTEQYVTEIELTKTSWDCNKPIYKSSLSTEFNAQIVEIRRNGIPVFSFERGFKLQEGDRLKIILNTDSLGNLKNSGGYRFLGEKISLYDLGKKHKIFETIIPFGSELAGSSLKQLRFRNLYQSSVLAIHHRNEVITENLSEITLKEGDVLLIYTSKESMKILTDKKLLLTLNEHEHSKTDYWKAIPALIIGLGVILVAAFNLTSILVSAMIGALLLVTTGIMKPKEAYESIEWKVIFMMAGVLSMGSALEKSGGSAAISHFISDTMGSLNPSITLALIFGLSFLSTNVLSSKATAALLSPIVIKLAQELQVSERPFLIAVMFACSLTFMTPVSHPANTLVYAPGNYKFNDFLKIGTPLNIIIWIAATIIIPWFFPFR
ncbi:MAG: SLC13 family permease [Bacteroidia bacterium]|nr:SLC13 family permease [Bacteroidia bacterium]